MYIDIYSCETQIRFVFTLMQNCTSRCLIISCETFDMNMSCNELFTFRISCKVWQYTKFWSNDNFLVALGVYSRCSCHEGIILLRESLEVTPASDWYSINFIANCDDSNSQCCYKRILCQVLKNINAFFNTFVVSSDGYSHFSSTVRFSVRYYHYNCECANTIYSNMRNLSVSNWENTCLCEEASLPKLVARERQVKQALQTNRITLIEQNCHDQHIPVHSTLQLMTQRASITMIVLIGV